MGVLNLGQMIRSFDYGLTGRLAAAELQYGACLIIQGELRRAGACSHLVTVVDQLEGAFSGLAYQGLFWQRLTLLSVHPRIGSWTVRRVRPAGWLVRRNEAE